MTLIRLLPSIVTTHLCFFCSFQNDEQTKQATLLLSQLGFCVEVMKSTLGHNIVTINLLLRKAWFGEKKILGFGNLNAFCGKEIDPDVLFSKLIQAYSSTEVAQPTPEMEILPSVLVALPSNANEEISVRKQIVQRLVDLGFCCKYVPLFSVNHSIMFVDFHHKEAKIGTHCNDEKYVVTTENFFELLKKLFGR